MKRKILAQKFLTFALTASVTATMFPTSAFAVTGSQVAADGTYTGAGNVKAAEDDDNEWNEYDISVSVGVQDGNISSISVTPGSTYDEESNSYFNKAKTGNKKKNQPGYESLIGQVATEETINSWDTVSGATRTSTAVKKAALEAIQSAMQGLHGQSTGLLREFRPPEAQHLQAKRIHIMNRIKELLIR